MIVRVVVPNSKIHCIEQKIAGNKNVLHIKEGLVVNISHAPDMRNKVTVVNPRNAYLFTVEKVTISSQVDRENVLRSSNESVNANNTIVTNVTVKNTDIFSLAPIEVYHDITHRIEYRHIDPKLNIKTVEHIYQPSAKRIKIEPNDPYAAPPSSVMTLNPPTPYYPANQEDEEEMQPIDWHYDPYAKPPASAMTLAPPTPMPAPPAYSEPATPGNLVFDEVIKSISSPKR